MNDSEPTGNTIAEWILAVLLDAFVLVVFVTGLCVGSLSAKAHEWFNHQRNPVTGWLCCNGGPTGDCQTIEDVDWWREGNDYAVRKHGVVYKLPIGHALPSQDRNGKAAACILNGRMLCFFLPVSG